MSKLARIYTIDRNLRARPVTSMQMLMEELEVAKSTVKREIDYMRDQLRAPILWDSKRRGYRYDGPFELAGIHLSSEEITALLIVQQIITRIDPGFVADHLREVIARAMGGEPGRQQEIAERIRFVRMAERPVRLDHFRTVGECLVRRCRLGLEYYSRSRDAHSSRTVSPQRLTYYRDNWYLDAWCHDSNGIRRFALDAIRGAEATSDAAEDVSDEVLDRELGSAYGAFTGPENNRAVLRFHGEIVRWISREVWHPDQEASLQPDGSYVLKVPYGADRELIMDILRYGNGVEVLDPGELRAKVRQSLGETLLQYSN